jgi:hypothetical protein
VEPKVKKRDWRKEYWKGREKREKINAKLRKCIERKRKRRPCDWSFEELSNPDHQWLEFLRDIQAVLGRGPEGREGMLVGKFLRLSYKYKSRPEPLRHHELKKMREMIRDAMVAEGTVPGMVALRKMYQFCKGKTKKELWK